MAKPRLSATDCDFDGKSTIACQAQDEDDLPVSAISVITLSGDSAKARQVPGSDTYSLTGMYRGIFVEKWVGKGTDAGTTDYRVLGTEGATRAEKLPGHFVGTTDHYAVFTIRDSVGDELPLVHDVTV